MSKQKQRLPRLTQAAGLCLLFAVSACETRVPSSDQTPPTVTLSILNYEGKAEVRIITNATTLPVSPDADFSIIAVGRDEQGVRGVTLSFDAFKQCGSGDVGSTQNFSGDDSNFDDPTIGVGDVARDRRIAALNVRGAYFYSCPSGYSLASASFIYVATALNFYGGRATSPQLTLTAPAP